MVVQYEIRGAPGMDEAALASTASTAIETAINDPASTLVATVTEGLPRLR